MNMFAMSDDLLSSEKILNAVSFGQEESLLSAIKDGGDPNYVRLDVSATLVAISRNYIGCLKILVENNAKSDIKNRKGWTAIHEASIQEEPDALNLILDNLNGSDLKVKDKMGKNALMASLEHNRYHNANLLIDKKPELLFSSDNEGNNVLLISSKNKNIEHFQWCLDHYFPKKLSDIDKEVFKKQNKYGENLMETLSEWPEGYKALEEYFEKKYQVSLKESMKTILSSNTKNINNESLSDKTESIQSNKDHPNNSIDTSNKRSPPSNPFGLGGIKKKGI